MTSKQTSIGLSHQFLISTPKLNDSIFNQSIVYICEHNENGTMGLKINDSLPLKINDLFAQLNIKTDNDNPVSDSLLLDGGPVNVDQGFILHDTKQQEWDSCLQISENVFVTTSKDILYAIANNQLKGQYLVVLGYSGWSPGQLKEELKDNAWMTLPATQDIIFNPDKTQIWQHCIDQLGFDFSQLSSVTGNA